MISSRQCLTDDVGLTALGKSLIVLGLAFFVSRLVSFFLDGVNGDWGSQASLSRLSVLIIILTR
jgi:hypothetical protein